MRPIPKLTTALAILLALAPAGWAQVSLTATTDTTIRKNWPTQDRSGNILEVRSLNGAPRQQIAYIRFDLRELTAAPASGAVFSVTRTAAGSSTSDTQIEVYGLREDFGNTPQAWVDTGLTYATSGQEIPWDGISTNRDLDLSRVEFLGNLPASSVAIGTLTVSGTALDAFLADRYASNQGLATFMIVQRENANRILYYFNTESTDVGALPPTLDFPSGTTQALPADTAPPTVAGGTPEPGAIDVLTNTTVTVRFSEPMDAPTIDGTTVLLEGPGSTAIPATFAYDAGSLTATLTPHANLAQGTVHTVRVVGGATGVADAAGNTMAGDHTWTFTTVADSEAPTVISVDPADLAMNVAYDPVVNVVFSEDMDAGTINDTTILLLDESMTPVSAGVAFDELTFTATLNPVPLLEPGTTYTVRVVGPGGVTDVATNELAADFTSTFTTLPFNAAAPRKLYPAADTHIRYGTNEGNNYGGSANIDTRQNDLAPRDYAGYIRFNLSDIPGPITSATFTITQSGGDTLVGGRFMLLGLDDSAGNTAQNWEEFALSYANAGSEANPAFGYPNPLAGASIFDPARTTNFDDGVFGITETVGGGTAQVSGETLAAWLETRRQSGGLATLLVDFPAAGGSGDKSLFYASRENLFLNPPTLDLTFDFPPVITNIERLAGPAYELTWQGTSNASYSIERSDTGLENPTWVALVEGLAGSEINTWTDTSPSAATAFYRIVAGPPGPLFFDDFDGAALGWTAGDDGTTSWDLGTPLNGPGVAASTPNCYVTNLGTDYGPNADVSLLSPVIDLTGVVDATLSFDQYFDVEGDEFDYCEVYARDETGAEIAALAAPLATYAPFSESLDWEPTTLPLPAEAVNRTVTFEFRFVSDSGTEFTGWYLDNVSVDLVTP